MFLIFRQPFVKRFDLCYWTTICPILSVTLVYCGQQAGWIKMKLGMQVDLGPGHIVLDGNPAPPPPKEQRPLFSVHICCGQMAGWIKMPLGRKVGLDPSDIVLDGHPAPPPQKGGRAPLQFSAHVYCGQMVAQLSYCSALVHHCHYFVTNICYPNTALVL